MSEKERELPGRPASGGTLHPAGGDGALASARARAEHLVRSADAAIARALSENSVSFLGATVQEGGQ